MLFEEQQQELTYMHENESKASEMYFTSHGFH